MADAFIPQDVHAPALQLNIDRYHAMEMGLSEHEVVNNVITALTSDGMIAPSYWVDPKSGNLYMLTVQYPDNTVKSLGDLRSIPVRSSLQSNTALLDTIADVKHIEKPTEVDHYQLRRVIDVYVAPHGEELSRVAAQVDRIIAGTKHPDNVIVSVRGIVGAMNTSFRSFGIGLILSVVLVYLVLVAQFKSFIDPFIILLAVPPGVSGVLIMLTATGTTLNIMSLMGVVMMVGVVVSNSILIVEFTHRLIADGMALYEAVRFAVRVRLRPVLMTSLATVIGLIPMALALGAGSESYCPARPVDHRRTDRFGRPHGVRHSRGLFPLVRTQDMKRLACHILLIARGRARVWPADGTADEAVDGGGQGGGPAKPSGLRRRPVAGAPGQGGPEGDPGSLSSRPPPDT